MKKLKQITLLFVFISTVLYIYYYSEIPKPSSSLIDTYEVVEEEVEDSDADENIHAFYYAWYGNTDADDKFVHWNHPFLSHWKKEESNKYATGSRHKPPNDIGSNFYPSLGAYSSSDLMVQKIHFNWLKKAKIGVIALSWYPLGKSDDEGEPRSEQFIREILDSALYSGIKVCFHIEPYEGRTAESVANDIKYLIKTYGTHDSMYTKRRPNSANWLPMFYIYDSYQIKAADWSRVLSNDSELRSSQDYNAIVIGLLLKTDNLKQVLESNFDGFYTYFASSKVSQASDPENWNKYQQFAVDNNLIFIPSVGPGYIDTNIRPWNSAMTVERKGGNTYKENWKSAVDSGAGIISITSFNEWHEGTQIEPAVPMTSLVDHYLGGRKPAMFTYKNYVSSPNYYLSLTRLLVDEFQQSGPQ